MPTGVLDDHATIARARGGDRDAIGQLWDAHTPALYGYLVHVLRDPDVAEDVLQRTWLQAIEALPAFGSRGLEFRAWIFAISRNECRQYWRRSNREVPLDPEIHDAPAPDRTGARDAALTVERALNQLSDDDRELLRLRYLADLPTADIARVLGTSAVAIRVRLHRALRRARTTIDHRPL